MYLWTIVTFSPLGDKLHDTELNYNIDHWSWFNLSIDYSDQYRRESKVGKELALDMTEMSSVLGIPHSPYRTVKSDS